MTQPFAVPEDGSVVITSAEIAHAQIVLPAVGLTLPEDFGRQAQEKADLIERRLERIERALYLEALR